MRSPWKKGQLRRPLRVAWLKEHEALWAGKPLDMALQKQIVKLMKVDGVLSEGTYWIDVNLTGIITELTQRIVKK
jgi:hypothetical protein